MSGQPPPPYHPYNPDGAPPPSFPPAFVSQPAFFPGSIYQTFPQAPTDSTLHHAGQLGHGVGSLLGYLGDKQEHPQPPKHAVNVMEPRPYQERGVGSYLAACSAALCCCCLWDLLHR